MHTMLKTPAVLAALFVTCFVPGFADAKVNAPRSIFPEEEAKSNTFNLQGHEKRFNAYHDKMTKDGKGRTFSKEFLAVHHGMEKGNYQYDLATARKVLKEVYANRMPAAPKGLKQQTKTKTQK